MRNKVESPEDIELNNQSFFNKFKTVFNKRICDTFKCNVSHHHKFIDLNNVVSYWISRNTLHIHLIPRDISDILKNPEELKKCELAFIDALDKIKKIMKKNKSIKLVYAVSPLVRKNTTIGDLFERYRFDVKSMPRDEAVKDEELSYFVNNIFTDAKNKRHTTKIWRAALPRDKFFSDEWEDMKNWYENELCKN